VKLIVGLGNIGIKYANTRHNIGFMLLDHIAARNGQAFKGWRSLAEVCKVGDWLLAKPLLYMNLSGGPVQSLMHFYKLSLDDLVVVHDDIDLPFMEVRTKRGGGSAGHNGIKSIDQHISNNYWRVRVGVGRPEDKRSVSDYVLGAFSVEEMKILEGGGYDVVEGAVRRYMAT
jgi:PTH1 family peptidyl-tRNA hydrolase